MSQDIEENMCYFVSEKVYKDINIANEWKTFLFNQRIIFMSIHFENRKFKKNVLT
jgi:hypothetical protein